MGIFRRVQPAAAYTVVVAVGGLVALVWLIATSAPPTLADAATFVVFVALGVAWDRISLRHTSPWGLRVRLSLVPTAMLALTTLVTPNLVALAAIALSLASDEASKTPFRRSVLHVLRSLAGAAVAVAIAEPASGFVPGVGGQGFGALAGAIAFSIVTVPLSLLETWLLDGARVSLREVVGLPILTAEISTASFAGMIAGAFTAHPALALVPAMPLTLLFALARRMEDQEQRLATQAAALQEASAQLARGERLSALGRLATGVAHELNNPLASILAAAELFAVERGDAVHERRARRLLRESRRAARIVSELLAFARPRELKLGWHRVDSIASEVVDLRGESCALASIALRTAIPLDVPLVRVDRHQIVQMLVNLVTNAEQALRQEGVPGTILVASRIDGQRQVEISVADDGPGIDESHLARVFEPFFTTKGDGSGTGLGLAICKSIVEAHGGTIDVVSAPGAGTRFAVKVPLATGFEHARPDDDEAELVTAGGVTRFADGVRVLVVDDEDGVRETVAEALVSWGCDVGTAASADEAIALAGLRRVDVVVADLHLRGSDGLTLHRRLSATQGAPATWIFMSGNPGAFADSALLARAGVPLLAKPFALAELRFALEETVSRYRAAVVRG